MLHANFAPESLPLPETKSRFHSIGTQSIFYEQHGNRRDEIINHVFLLLLTLFLSGCMAPPIKAPAYKTAELHKILVVPVETPPLEVIPDPIESRLPVQSHFQNMEIEVPLQKRIYINPGHVLISGLISNDDTVREFVFESKGPNDKPELAAIDSNYWLPSLALAENLITQLSSDSFDTQLSPHYYRLPNTATRSAHPTDWRKAVSDWYEQTQSTVDYRHLSNVDAVLEIGIGTYKIFEGQTSLQILMKLIDPNDGSIIARTSAETFSTTGSTSVLLDNESRAFKSLITEMGARLVSRGLLNIGLPSKKVAMYQDPTRVQTLSD